MRQTGVYFPRPFPSAEGYYHSNLYLLNMEGTMMLQLIAMVTMNFYLTPFPISSFHNS